MSTPELNLRVLPESEYWKLAPIYSLHQEPIPDPKMSRVVVIEAGDKVIASFAIHNVLMAGLLHVDERVRQSGLGDVLAKAVQGMFKEGDSVFMVTDNPVVKSEAERQGWVELEGTLMRRDF